MDLAELWRLSATEAAGLIRAGTIESGDLVLACLERVARVEPDVQAWTFLDPDHAMAQARAADEWRRRWRPAWCRWRSGARPAAPSSGPAPTAGCSRSSPRSG